MLIGEQESLFSEIIINDIEIDDISQDKRSLAIDSRLRLSAVLSSIMQPELTEEKEETEEECYSSCSSYNSVSDVSIDLN